jgi:cell division protein ZapA (FtsZ GTPase activity inhibitor)
MARQPDGKPPVTVDIFGQSYTVRSDDEPGVQRAAAAVDQRMQEIAQRTRTISPIRIAVLAALYFAYEHCKSVD